MVFPRIELYNEWDFESFRYSDTSDMLQNDLYTSNDKSEMDDIVFEGNRMCIETDDSSIMFKK